MFKFIGCDNYQTSAKVRQKDIVCFQDTKERICS